MLQQQLYVCISHIAAGHVMLYKASSFCKILFETVSHDSAVVVGSEVKIKTTVRGNIYTSSRICNKYFSHLFLVW